MWDTENVYFTAITPTSLVLQAVDLIVSSPLIKDMPRCPHCDFNGVFETYDQVGSQSGVDDESKVLKLIICPDCDAVLGGQDLR